MNIMVNRIIIFTLEVKNMFFFILLYNFWLSNFYQNIFPPKNFRVNPITYFRIYKKIFQKEYMY